MGAESIDEILGLSNDEAKTAEKAEQELVRKTFGDKSEGEANERGAIGKLEQEATEKIGADKKNRNS